MTEILNAGSTDDDRIVVGCWLDTPHGEAVCVEVRRDYVSYRYASIPCRDGKPQVLEQIWVLNGDHLDNVSFKSPSNFVSHEVTLLKGPYGTGEHQMNDGIDAQFALLSTTSINVDDIGDQDN